VQGEAFRIGSLTERASRQRRGHPVIHRQRPSVVTVVDASIVVRLLQNRRSDGGLRERFAQPRYVHAPALIDAEVTFRL
jgi:hypothetical protein